MAHKVILPPKKNYIPQFLKQRDINSYCLSACNVLLMGLFSKLLSSIVLDFRGHSSDDDKSMGLASMASMQESSTTKWLRFNWWNYFLFIFEERSGLHDYCACSENQIIWIFVKFIVTKNTNKCFLLSLCCWIRDPGWKKSRICDKHPHWADRKLGVIFRY